MEREYFRQILVKFPTSLTALKLHFGENRRNSAILRNWHGS